MTGVMELSHVSYRYHGGTADALADVTLSIPQGQGFGLVGESGSGKSTALAALLGLTRPDRGKVSFDGSPLPRGSGASMRPFRAAVQVVFQDPYTSLDPRQRIGSILAEPLASLRLEPNRSARLRRVAEALAVVGLEADAVGRYPHEFSGGQRQRIAIARALITNPRVLLADEPVSALDVTTKIDIVELLGALHRQHNFTLVMVSHDLSVVAALCHTMAVMSHGRVVEVGPTSQVLNSPNNPQTQALVRSIPRMVAR